MHENIKIQAIPDSKEFEILGFDEWRNALKIKVHSKAEKGLANKELEERLGKIFGCEVKIAKGKKSRSKILEIPKDREKIMKIISANSSSKKK